MALVLQRFTVVELFSGLGFLPILQWNEQHPKTFTFFFTKVLVMNLVGFADRPEVTIISPGKPLKTLVDEDVVNKKVCDAVKQDPQPNVDQEAQLGVDRTKNETTCAWYGKNEKESIVLFKESRSSNVVVFVQVPQKTVHDVFVGKPGNEFHEQKCRYGDQCVGHILKLSDR